MGYCNEYDIGICGQPVQDISKETFQVMRQFGAQEDDLRFKCKVVLDYKLKPTKVDRTDLDCAGPYLPEHLCISSSISSSSSSSSSSCSSSSLSSSCASTSTSESCTSSSLSSSCSCSSSSSSCSSSSSSSFSSSIAALCLCEAE